MKISFLFFSVLLLLFSSCTSLPQIEKRHYREGFYIAKNREHSSVVLKKDSLIPEIKSIVLNKIRKPEKISKMEIIPVVRNSFPAAKKVLLIKKFFKKNNSSSIVLPKKEPINKKAKAAVILLLVAKLSLGISFLTLLLTWINIFLLLSAIAAFFAILAIVFALWARKEIGKEEGINKELGEKEAKFVLERAAGGLLVYTLLILIAIIVNAIQKSRGQ